MVVLATTYTKCYTPRQKVFFAIFSCETRHSFE